MLVRQLPSMQVPKIGSLLSSVTCYNFMKRGFSVLEVNAGCQRSKKHILDLFGEATQSHQVSSLHTAATAATTQPVAPVLKGKRKSSKIKQAKVCFMIHLLLFIDTRKNLHHQLQSPVKRLYCYSKKWIFHLMMYY